MHHQKKQMTVAKTFFKGQFSPYLAFWTKTLERACSTYRKICDKKNFRYDVMSIPLTLLHHLLSFNFSCPPPSTPFIVLPLFELRVDTTINQNTLTLNGGEGERVLIFFFSELISFEGNVSTIIFCCRW